MFTDHTSVIIPTKNRSSEVIALIDQLNNLNINFQELLIVDSSDTEHSDKIYKMCNKENFKYFKTKPSTSYQRNYGMSKINQNKFVMFIDDDVVLFDDTFEKMDKCIQKFGEDDTIGAFGFNQIDNENKSFLENLKQTNLIKKLNIYPSSPGRIARSGWQSKILNLKEDIIGDWIFTTICIYKYRDIKNNKFDETFGQYSYLEDLDFSLNLLKQKKKIYISSEAKFLHPQNIDRSGFNFGVTEIKNRYKIVNKYKLSKKLFFIGSFLRFLLSFLKSFSFKRKYFLRCLGNIYSIFTIHQNK